MPWSTGGILAFITLIYSTDMHYRSVHHLHAPETSWTNMMHLSIVRYSFFYCFVSLIKSNKSSTCYHRALLILRFPKDNHTIWLSLRRSELGLGW
jgi:hypothetical protein